MNQPQQLNQSNRTSAPAVLALVFTVLTVPMLFCCSPIGCASGFLAIGLGIWGALEFHSGKADQASGIMAWISVLASVAMLVGYLMLVGIAGLMGAFDEHGIEVPEEYSAPQDPQHAPAPPKPQPK